MKFKTSTSSLIMGLARLTRVLLLGQLCVCSSLASGQDVTTTRGQEILQPFKQQLMQALQDGLQEGPIAAIDACRINAPMIASTLSGDSIRVGRSSHKLRNQENTPPAWVSPVMQEYQQNSEDRQPRVVSLDNGRAGYVEAITLQPLCTACHGKNVDPSVLKVITDHYPLDQATGFDVGELRGVFWTEFPVD